MDGLLAVMREVGGEGMAIEDLRELRCQLQAATQKALKTDPRRALVCILLHAMIGMTLFGRELK